MYQGLPTANVSITGQLEHHLHFKLEGQQLAGILLSQVGRVA